MFILSSEFNANYLQPVSNLDKFAVIYKPVSNLDKFAVIYNLSNLDKFAVIYNLRLTLISLLLSTTCV